MKLKQKVSNLAGYLPNPFEHKEIFVYLFLLLFFVFSSSFATSRLISTIQTQKQMEEQRAEMQSYIAQWKQKSERVNKAAMRPVKPEQLDNVQMAILLNFQSHQINLSSLKEKMDKNEKNGKLYEIELNGEYPQIIDCIQHFNVKDALIGTKQFSMEMKDNKMRVHMTYKIYTK